VFIAQNYNLFLTPQLFGVIPHKAYYKTLGKEIQLFPLELIGLFKQFQLIIRVALGKEDAVKINPIELFDFDNYSKLNITIL
jgi:hypothetical protein